MENFDKLLKEKMSENVTQELIENDKFNNDEFNNKLNKITSKRRFKMFRSPVFKAVVIILGIIIMSTSAYAVSKIFDPGEKIEKLDKQGLAQDINKKISFINVKDKKDNIEVVLQKIAGSKTGLKLKFIINENVTNESKETDKSAEYIISSLKITTKKGKYNVIDSTSEYDDNDDNSLSIIEWSTRNNSIEIDIGGTAVGDINDKSLDAIFESNTINISDIVLQVDENNKTKKYKSNEKINIELDEKKINNSSTVVTIDDKGTKIEILKDNNSFILTSMGKGDCVDLDYIIQTEDGDFIIPATGVGGGMSGQESSCSFEYTMNSNVKSNKYKLYLIKIDWESDGSNYDKKYKSYEDYIRKNTVKKYDIEFK